MASIGTTFPTSNNASTQGSTNNSSSQSGSASDPLANESTFLTLLVSQLKNQDPASPMDGTTFVTQLAQFSDLEQNLAMRQDLDAMSLKYAGTSSNSSTDSTNSDDSTTGTGAASGTNGSQS